MRPLLRDLLVGGAVLIALWMTVVPDSAAGRAWQVSLAGCCLIAVALRARLPLAATTVATAATITGWSMGLTADPCVMLALCLFAVAESRGSRLFPWWVLAATGSVGILMLLTGGENAQTGIRSVALSAIVLSASWALGTRTRQARNESAARARAEERLRLGREVHDVLSHSLGTIGVQAGVAAHIATLGQDELRATLREVEADARSSLAELHGLLHRERENAECTPGVPLDETIQALTTSLDRVGIRSGVQLVGNLNSLSVTIQQSLLRIAREAITNVIRHSGASTCRVLLAVEANRTILRVEDDGHGTGGVVREGHGLTGLRERVALLGGQLDVSDTGEGMALQVTIPTTDGVRA